MNFETFLNKLAYGQLKNTSATDDAQDGFITPKYESQLLDLTNQGLIDITSRKKLYEGRGVIEFVANQNIYSMTGFDDFVKVMSVVTEDERKHTPKSNAHITIPDPSSLRFTDRFIEMAGTGVDVIYQMTHPAVELTTGDITLPKHLIESLLLYVSGLYLSHMGGADHKAQGDSYYGLYLKQMTDDTMTNASGVSEVVDEDTRFYDRGFV